MKTREPLNICPTNTWVPEELRLLIGIPKKEHETIRVSWLLGSMSHLSHLTLATQIGYDENSRHANTEILDHSSISFNCRNEMRYNTEIH